MLRIVILFALSAFALNEINSAYDLNFIVEIEQSTEEGKSEKEEKNEKELDDYLHLNSSVYCKNQTCEECYANTVKRSSQLFQEITTPPPETEL